MTGSLTSISYASCPTNIHSYGGRDTKSISRHWAVYFCACTWQGFVPAKWYFSQVHSSICFVFCLFLSAPIWYFGDLRWTCLHLSQRRNAAEGVSAQTTSHGTSCKVTFCALDLALLSDECMCRFYSKTYQPFWWLTVSQFGFVVNLPSRKK